MLRFFMNVATKPDDERAACGAAAPASLNLFLNCNVVLKSFENGVSLGRCSRSNLHENKTDL